MAFLDKQHRVVSYHDTWISIDPIKGCRYQCAYCVLKHAGRNGVDPQVVVEPPECAKTLFAYPLFTLHETPLAIGNETDMFYRRNRVYLLAFLHLLAERNVRNPISLITKSPLSDSWLAQLREFSNLRIVFFLSYSGLGPDYEPNFTDRHIRANFDRVKKHGFAVIHYWRPLLPSNTAPPRVRCMLRFSAAAADACVFTGLKLNPELNRILRADGIPIPDNRMDEHGEWLDEEVILRIYEEAERVAPDLPLYRHTSCALARVFGCPNHTATVFREDICPPSRCPREQRAMCGDAKRIPEDDVIKAALARLHRSPPFSRRCDQIVVDDVVSQEEFSFLLHTLNCPLKFRAVRFDNIYRGNIHSQ